MWESVPETLFLFFEPNSAQLAHLVPGIELKASEEVGIILMTPISVLLALLFLMTFTLLVVRAHFQTKRHNELLIARLEYRAQNIALKQKNLQEQHQIAVLHQTVAEQFQHRDRLGQLGGGRRSIDLSKAIEGLPDGAYTFAVEVVNGSGEPASAQAITTLRVDGVRYGEDGPVLTAGEINIPVGRVVGVVD